LVKDATLDREALNVFGGNKENVFKKEWKMEPRGYAAYEYR
jgi:hypothetical protein